MPLKENKKQSTIDNYEASLEGLRKKMPRRKRFDLIKPSDLEKLDCKANTKRNYVSALIYKYGDGLKYTKELKDYRDNIHTEYKKNANVYTEEEISSYPIVDELKKVYMTNKTRSASLSKVIVAFYLYPFISMDTYGIVRNEIYDIINTTEYLEGKNTYNPDTGYIRFERFKTSEYEDSKPIEITLPDEVKEVFNEFIKKKNIEHGERFFPKATSQTISHALSLYINNVTGKKATSRTLRKVYLHKKHGEDYRRIQATADSMGHGISTAGAIYSKYGSK
jgi:hypothetical protein